MILIVMRLASWCQDCLSEAVKNISPNIYSINMIVVQIMNKPQGKFIPIVTPPFEKENDKEN